MKKPGSQQSQPSNNRKPKSGKYPNAFVAPREEYPMRINKYLAVKNYSTRKGGDELVAANRVYINGTLAQLGDKVIETDVVEVKTSKKPKKYIYLAYNKAEGVTTHSPTMGEADVMSTVDLKDVFPIGRLDKDSHGLMILTNDGRVTDRLLNPKYVHEKEYIVTTVIKLRSSFKDKMENGVNIGEGIITSPCKVTVLNDTMFKIILSEGKKHQIRRMCSALFNDVKDLKRIRIMNIHLGTLKEGRYRVLEGNQLEEFLKSLGL